MSKEFDDYLTTVLEADPVRLVISNPQDKATECRKITLRKINPSPQGGGEGYYQAERLIGGQAFHENLDTADLRSYITRKIPGEFTQINAFSEQNEFILYFTKNDSVKFSKNKSLTMVHAQESHNREKKYVFKKGEFIEPLIDMGIFTPDGKIVHSMYDKYRQINRFIETIDELLSKGDYQQLNVIDFGCGKGYVTFLLYYYLAVIKNIKTTMVGVDQKADVIQKCQSTAIKYKYSGLSFQCAGIETFSPGFSPDIVLSLHACDTATDHVLYKAISWNTEMIFTMPCCQHELNRQIKTPGFAILTRYGILKENISAILTDAIRGNILTCHGYKVEIMDIVNPVNTPKNILLRASKSPIDEAARVRALEEVTHLCCEFDLHPTLLSLMNSR
jgi:SAM-dependent methyltransferase